MNHTTTATNNNNGIKAIIFTFLCKQHCICLIKKSGLIGACSPLPRESSPQMQNKPVCLRLLSKNDGREMLMVEW